MNVNRRIEDLGKKVTTLIRQLADLYDRDAHKDEGTYKPGNPCRSCLIRTLADVVAVGGLSAMEAMELGPELSVRGCYYTTGRHATETEKLSMRFMLMVDFFRRYVAESAVENGLKAENPADVPKAMAIRDEAVAYLLYNLIPSSEEIQEKVMPLLIQLEAKAKAEDDHENRRN